MKKELRILGIPVYQMRSDFYPSVGSATNPSEKLIAALGGQATDAGVKIDQDSAITISAVWRAVNILSGTLASLPLKVYQIQKDGTRQSVAAHPAQSLMKKPNSLMTDFIFRETMMALLLLWGNAYAVIRRDGDGEILELILVHPDDVIVTKYQNKLYYNVRTDTSQYVTLPQENILHIPGIGFNGLVGKSVITPFRESLGLTLAAQKFGAKFFGSGANMDGVLEVPGTLTDDTYLRIRKSWDDRYTGLSNAHSTAILEGGMKYNRIGIPPEDAQFLQTRQFQISEVARWFGVQPHLLMDLDRATNNNIEHQGMEFVTFTLTPWVARWEAELNRKMFKSDEKDLYMEYNLNGLLRGDAKSRGEYYRLMWGMSAISANEIRRLENQAPYEGGDQFFAQAGFMPVEDLKNYHLSKNKKDEPKE